jgi:hypothetical protein
LVMVFNATFNKISVLLVEEIGENNWPAASHWQTLSHNVISSTTRLSRIRTRSIVDWHWLHYCKSNYHMITTTEAPKWFHVDKSQLYIIKYFFFRYGRKWEKYIYKTDENHPWYWILWRWQKRVH